MGFQLGVPLIKYLWLFYVSLFGYYGWYELLGIIDGDDCSDYESDFWSKLRIIVASCFGLIVVNYKYPY